MVETQARAALSAPLYAFDLPQALVSSLEMRGADRVDDEDAAPAAAQAAATSTPRPRAPGTAPACSLCPGSQAFESVALQRAHFRTLWHRYNLALRQYGAQPPSVPAPLHLVTRDELDRQCDELEDDEGITDQLSALMARLDVREEQEAGGGDAPARIAARAAYEAMRSPLVWFETPADRALVLEQTQLGIYRDVLLASDARRARDGSTPAPRELLAALATPRLTMRQGTGAWPGKHLQGTHHVGRAMQMHVLDGMGLLPWLTPEDLHGGGDESGDTSEDSSASEADELTDESDAAGSELALPPLRLWTFIMMGGGHFAAAVVALNVHAPPLSARAQARGAREQRSVLVLAHKTFHRYTTRRKQGGSQAAQDATGRHAKSAGANLRRYGEQQLRDEIHTLLNRRGWRELIARSEHVWVRAPMRAAPGVLWHWPGSVVSPLDESYANGTLSSIPIATQRPTLSEILRCFFELTRVKMAHLTADELAAQDDAQREKIAAALRADAARNAPPPAPRRRERAATEARRPKRDADEAARRERWERLVAMVRKGKVETLVQFLARHEATLLDGAIDAPLPLWWRRGEMRGHGTIVPATLLQLAAAADQPEVVHYLLVERRANPTLPATRVPSEGAEAALPPTAHRTAYDLCPGRATRAVFRRLMAEQPTWWPWDDMASGARVPSALTSEMEEAQASKSRTRRAAMRDKLREREAKTGAPAVAEPPEAPPPQPPRAARNVPLDAGLSDEMRRRIEREKRARAAEARIAAMRR